ncbi:hypothetical protein [Deinococcus radiophilus]|uniref:hypothetical protein n=1 Tax=Deinococcus radiophilus TaxID=32062 RepID=UPI0036180663
MFTQLFRTLMAAALLSSPALLGGTALAGGLERRRLLSSPLSPGYSVRAAVSWCVTSRPTI